MLAEPAQSLTDLALGAVAVTIAVQLRRMPELGRGWAAAFWWFGVAAVVGGVHHGVIVRWAWAAAVSWPLISVMVVVAVSYLLAATVLEVLGPTRRRLFWLLRLVGVVAYAAMAMTGRAGVATILVCESVTMLTVVVLWLWAAYRRHPRAAPVLLAILTSGAAAAVMAMNPDVARPVGLDSASAYHLAQIAGLVMLYVALVGGRLPTLVARTG